MSEELEKRPYKAIHGICVTRCDKNIITMVGSCGCTRRCRYFHSSDLENKVVKCKIIVDKPQ